MLNVPEAADQAKDTPLGTVPFNCVTSSGQAGDITVPASITGNALIVNVTAVLVALTQPLDVSLDSA